MTTFPSSPAPERPGLDLSDEEVDSLCRGLRQNWAKVRFLRSLGYKVDRRPDGTPLLLRSELTRHQQPAPDPQGTDGIRWTKPVVEKHGSTA